jgi:Protein of unknown function (DUF3619)
MGVTMNEQDFGRAIAKKLNAGLTDMPAEQVSKLNQSRNRAMAAYREPISILGLATVGGPSANSKFGWLIKPMILAPVALIAIAIISANIWQDELQNDQNDGIDAAILSQELPIQAFLDNDMETWIKAGE